MSTGSNTLWIHGWGTSPKVWLPFAGSETEPPSPCFTDIDLVDAVVKAGIQRQADTLIGWSLGGMLAIAATPHIPTVRRLVLFGSAPTFCRTSKTPGWPPSVLRRMRRQFKTDPAATRQHFLEEHLPNHHKLHALSDTYDDPGLAFLETADLRDPATNLTLSILHIHGKLDSLFPCPTAEQAKKQFPSATLDFHNLEKCGHAPFLDAPDVCRQLLSNFLT